MASALAADGVALAGVFACPHLADRNCFCRKPRPGLIYRAINELPFLVDLERSILVGDTESDTEAGLAAGVPVRIAVADNLPASATHVASRLEDVLSLVDAAVLPQPAPHSA
jgi:D-glycero-D-manno-heptose 1,7-bisphosphate phosphatase